MFCRCSTLRMIYILMGVSGSGKSSLGAFLSEKLGWPLHEGDDYHTQENIQKMSRGDALSDQDRIPWLLKLHQLLQRELCAGSNALMTCSALKHHYRRVLLHGSRALSADPHHELLLSASPDVYFLFLSGDTSLIQQRMMERKGHYMKAHMLTSQIKALEPPQSDEDNVLLLDVSRSISDLATDVQKHIKQLQQHK
ncbi:probable gluconokinase [Gouania willdenowi]|uniref:Gluconokinase n=1 Tax=Gouania willdenowi TaxID=441366 RepID=A0A8C5G950_GOUWI|nr:probable gluconokinase [Gouania willdenowi]